MDDDAAKAFNYYLGRTTLFNWVGLYPSMQNRNENMSRARLRYRDAVRRHVFNTTGKWRHYFEREHEDARLHCAVVLAEDTVWCTFTTWSRLRGTSTL